MSEDTPGSDALSAAVADVADAVIVTDAGTGDVVAVNDAVERVFGHAPATFRDLDPGEYTADPAAARAAREDARRRATDGEPATARWTARRRDGSTFRAESTVSTTTVDGRPCFVAVVRDVSDRTERERKLERFAEVLTHDLRSPLNAAEAQVDILRAESTGGGEWLDRLERVHGRMADIVDDVRTLVSGDQRVCDPQPIDLNEAVRDAWATTTDERSAAELVVAGDLGTVTADATRLGRLFENLFENAIRHGSDRVTVTVAPLDDADGIAVTDDGPGIPDEAVGRVFEYGYTTTSDGTGFGLNIVAAAAEAHGWEVAVGEAATGGARFEITGMGRVRSGNAIDPGARAHPDPD
jgi:PAS domain S-box-containing protein